MPHVFMKTRIGTFALAAALAFTSSPAQAADGGASGRANSGAGGSAFTYTTTAYWTGISWNAVPEGTATVNLNWIGRGKGLTLSVCAWSPARAVVARVYPAPGTSRYIDYTDFAGGNCYRRVLGYKIWGYRMWSYQHAAGFKRAWSGVQSIPRCRLARTC